MDPALLAITPAAPPPPGVIPDFVNGEKYGLHAFVVATAVACIVVSTVVVALRMLARLVVIKTTDWSDYFAVLGWAFSVAFMGCVLKIDDVRRGRHQWDVSLLNYVQTLELENIASIIYCLGVGFSKLSILFLFKKVFVPVHEGLVYHTNQILIWTNAAFYIGGMVALIVQCVPRAKISNPTLPGRCTNVYLSFLLSGVWNVCSDFFILAFPIWAIWHLQMPLKRKFGITIVFATGAFALISSIMRLHSTAQIASNPDVTYIICKVSLWTVAEMCTVLLCGSFPFLPKLARLFRGPRSTDDAQAQSPKAEKVDEENPNPALRNGSDSGSDNPESKKTGIAVSEVENMQNMHTHAVSAPPRKPLQSWDDTYKPV